MPYKKYYKPKPKKPPEIKEVYDAVKWLKKHPEDIPMAKENLAARDKGYDNDAVRNLMAAICLRACADYKAVLSGKRPEKLMNPELVMKDCHDFFSGDIFQFFINRMSVEEIEKTIRATPDGAISELMDKL